MNPSWNNIPKYLRLEILYQTSIPIVDCKTYANQAWEMLPTEIRNELNTHDFVIAKRKP